MAEQRIDRFMELEERYADYTVYDMHYEKIGKIDDIFVDGNDNPEYIGVKTGFLGTRTTLIPIELVRANDKRRLVEVAVDKDTVEEGPTFGDDREITPEFEQRVLSYYRVEVVQAPRKRRAYGAYYSDAIGDGRPNLWPDELTGSREGGSHLEDDKLEVHRVEEGLRAGTRERESGSVNVRKRVRTGHERLEVPKKHQEMHVERIPAEDQESTEAEIADDEIRVPVIEEEIVVEKRPVVKEEIRVRKEVVEEEEVVEADVRKEEVDIDDLTERRETDRKKSETPKKSRKHIKNTKTAKDTRKKAQKGLPIENYDDLTVEETKKKLGGLSESELKKIRSYEKKHKNRKSLIEQLDRKVRAAS